MSTSGAVRKRPLPRWVHNAASLGHTGVTGRCGGLMQRARHHPVARDFPKGAGTPTESPTNRFAAGSTRLCRLLATVRQTRTTHSTLIRSGGTCVPLLERFQRRLPRFVLEPTPKAIQARFPAFSTSNTIPTHAVFITNTSSIRSPALGGALTCSNLIR